MGEGEEEKEKTTQRGLQLVICYLSSCPPTNTAESFLFVGWREEGIVSDPLFSPEIIKTCFPINWFH